MKCCFLLCFVFFLYVCVFLYIFFCLFPDCCWIYWNIIVSFWKVSLFCVKCSCVFVLWNIAFSFLWVWFFCCCFIRHVFLFGAVFIKCCILFFAVTCFVAMFLLVCFLFVAFTEMLISLFHYEMLQCLCKILHTLFLCFFSVLLLCLENGRCCCISGCYLWDLLDTHHHQNKHYFARMIFTPLELQSLGGYMWRRTVSAQ